MSVESLQGEGMGIILVARCKQAGRCLKVYDYAPPTKTMGCSISQYGILTWCGRLCGVLRVSLTTCFFSMHIIV